MRVRLLKSWDSGLKKFAIGTVIEVSDGKAKELIQVETAERYSGEYPPKGKVKTEFFKPKKRIRNGKG
jgi:hypothetical protein